MQTSVSHSDLEVLGGSISLLNFLQGGLFLSYSVSFTCIVLLCCLYLLQPPILQLSSIKQPLHVLTTAHHLHKTVKLEAWEVVTQVKGDTFCIEGKGKKAGKLLYTKVSESLLGSAFYPVLT